MPQSFNPELVNVKTREFSTNGDFYPQDSKDISLKTAFGFSHDEEQFVILTRIRLEFVNEKMNDSTFLMIEIQLDYKFVKEEFIALIKDNAIVLDRKKATMLISIGLGTARGAFHAYTENTKFNKYPLPLLNATTFVTNDLLLPIVDKLQPDAHHAT